MIIVAFAIDSEDFVLGEVLSDGETDTQIQLTQLVPIGTDFVPYFWVTDSGDRKTYEKHVRDDPRVDSLRQLDERIDRTLYRIEWADGIDGFLDALRTNAVFTEEASGNAKRWLFRMRADTQQAFSQFQQDCLDVNVRLDIRQVMYSSTPTGSMKYNLSDKQAEALELAFNGGHFEVPRTITQAELAENIGISRQAFSRRLCRALSSLIGTTYMMELDHVESTLDTEGDSGDSSE